MNSDIFKDRRKSFLEMKLTFGLAQLRIGNT
jgi:hypothetical protein